jgi:hypothetical protein
MEIGASFFSAYFQNDSVGIIFNFRALRETILATSNSNMQPGIAV